MVDAIEKLKSRFEQKFRYGFEQRQRSPCVRAQLITYSKFKFWLKLFVVYTYN